MKILITGGAGFIGSHLSLDLINCGHCVTVIDSLSTQIHGEQPDEDSYTYRMIKDKVRVIAQSFISEELLRDELKETEIVIHLASETGTGQSMYELARYNYINVYGTALLLECLKKYPNKVRQFYLSSSRSIYGEGKYFSEKEGIIYPDLRREETLSKGNFAVGYNDDFSVKPLPTDEESKIHPISIYGLTKKHQEDLVLLALKNTTIQPIIFRFQNVYGPGQSLKNPYTGVLSVFSTLARENKKIDIYEDGLESRDFVFISDIIQAFNCCLNNNITNDNAIFNVGFSKMTTITEVAEILVKLFNSKSSISVSGNYRLGDIRHNYADISKIQKLGFQPNVNIEMGLKLFYDWVILQPQTDNYYEKSVQEMKKFGIFK